ncbi:M48 family metalloprotease [Patescibacteria group bacterium AH-259-L07]|nr:M48 family metalloprotease [Patescibacteria group bacterium AH-259-L07]
MPFGILTKALKKGITFYLLSIFLYHQGLFEAFLMQHVSIYAGLVFFMMLYTPIAMILPVFSNVISRKHEYEADAYAKETTNYRDKIAALKKVALHNLDNLRPHPFYVFLNQSHPDT